MQIDIFPENSLTFKITSDEDNAVGIFTSVMKKCREEALKKGFRNMFNSDERSFIKEFTDKIQYDET
jgi:hypothetical protein